jgi:hypothetical protein
MMVENLSLKYEPEVRTIVRSNNTVIVVERIARP